MQNLPKKLSTLQKQCQCQLLLPLIHKTTITLRPEKQPTGILKPDVGSLFFFDLHVIVNMLLLVSTRQAFHIGMAEIVNFPTEYWHSHSWGSSIRTCSNDFAKYPDELPVFLLDMIQYHCIQDGCGLTHSSHCGQVTFFGCDRRWGSFITDQVLLKIHPLMSTDNVLQDPILEHCDILEDEMLLIEDMDEYICSNQIIACCVDIAFHRENKSLSTKYSVYQLFNARTGHTRSVNLLSPIRAELELKVLDCSYLTAQLMKNIKSFPILLFIDNFGLYRNMYRTGVYAIPAGLPFAEH